MTIEFDKEDNGMWICEIVDYPGVMACGKTKFEALTKAVSILEYLLK